jgi:hypothetical protein
MNTHEQLLLRNWFGAAISNHRAIARPRSALEFTRSIADSLQVGASTAAGLSPQVILVSHQDYRDSLTVELT